MAKDYEMPDPSKMVTRCAISSGPSGQGHCPHPATTTAQTYVIDATFHLVIGVCEQHSRWDSEVNWPAGWELGIDG